MIKRSFILIIKLVIFYVLYGNSDFEFQIFILLSNLYDQLEEILYSLKNNEQIKI